MRGLRNPKAAASFLLAVALVAGCGGGDQTGEVSGIVTYDGKPVESGGITFSPEKGPTAGGVIKDGKYTATVAVGPAKVSITGSKIVGEKKAYNTPNSPVGTISAESLPAKYNKATQLRYDVQPGAQTKDFDLPK
jgi:hypothetical protein